MSADAHTTSLWSRATILSIVSGQNRSASSRWAFSLPTVPRSPITTGTQRSLQLTAFLLSQVGRHGLVFRPLLRLPGLQVALVCCSHLHDGHSARPEVPDQDIRPSFSDRSLGRAELVHRYFKLARRSVVSWHSSPVQLSVRVRDGDTLRSENGPDQYVQKPIVPPLHEGPFMCRTGREDVSNGLRSSMADSAPVVFASPQEHLDIDI